MALYTVRPLSWGLNDFAELERMQKMQDMPKMGEKAPYPVLDTDKASFLDIFRGLVDNVIETNEQVDKDAIDLMLGNIDNIAEMQANIEKANMAVELLVTVKNETLSAYNSIINMQI